MIILSHRGYWKDPAEKNLPVAFRHSFERGFGTETDVRDCAGKLLISHDPPKGSEMTLDDLLGIMAGRNLPLAINIKADGLAWPLGEVMRKHGHTNWFVFDMSVPDTRQQFLCGNPVYARRSEIEPEMPWHEKAAGIWLDAYESEWYDGELIKRLRAKGKKVCVVSSDLHKRPTANQWRMFSPLARDSGIMLCTDVPEDARAFFEK